MALSEGTWPGRRWWPYICTLAQRMRLPRANVREFCRDWFGLSLFTTLINQCVHAAARAVEPEVEQETQPTVRNVELPPDRTTALRHWVIARRLGMGTRTRQGTRAFALLCSPASSRPAARAPS